MTQLASLNFESSHLPFGILTRKPALVFWDFIILTRNRPSLISLWFCAGTDILLPKHIELWSSKKNNNGEIGPDCFDKRDHSYSYYAFTGHTTTTLHTYAGFEDRDKWFGKNTIREKFSFFFDRVQNHASLNWESLSKVHIRILQLSPLSPSTRILLSPSS